MIHALRGLNEYGEVYPLSVSGHIGVFNGVVGFEVGVAEGIFFNYLDDDEVFRLTRPLGPRWRYPLLDLLIIVTYHYFQEGKKIALNFDHHYFRFTYGRAKLEIKVFHMKGIRRMPLNELLNRVITRINERMEKDYLRSLIVTT